jgi:hypothetical protein
LKAAREAVLAEAGARQTRPRELATTLVLLLASPGWAAGAQIGDGAALIAGPSGEPRVLTRPWLSEHLNETTFLTSDTALDRPQIEIARTEVTQAVAFSDGLQMLALKLPEATPHPRFFGPLLRFAAAAADPAAGEAQLAAFLRSPRLTQRTDDDLTLLLATWAPGAPTAAPHPCASNVHPTGPS